MTGLTSGGGEMSDQESNFDQFWSASVISWSVMTLDCDNKVRKSTKLSFNHTTRLSLIERRRSCYPKWKTLCWTLTVELQHRWLQGSQDESHRHTNIKAYWWQRIAAYFQSWWSRGKQSTSWMPSSKGPSLSLGDYIQHKAFSLWGPWWSSKYKWLQNMHWVPNMQAHHTQ